ncbi:MAG: SMP-30/gluconolactonase/LRE family protein [bacterium]|nr:SMP-30/gluconolactonase/LRE family protein [bacterium]
MKGRFLILFSGLLVAASLESAEVKIFRADTRETFVGGTCEGTSLGPLGGVGLARRVERRAAIEEPFVFTAASHADGWVIGTGNSGRVLRVTADGDVEELFAAAEPEVFAVWADPDGTVLAATSPQGKVYSIAGGEGSVVFDPEDGYLWDLARDRDGRLLVATGLPGRLYRLDPGGEAELLFESVDSHVRAIAALPDGGILAGTAGQGLILRVAADGKLSTLYDAVQPEVLGFTVRPDGGAYAVVLASEASFVDLSAGQRTANGNNGNGNGNGNGEGEGQVTVSVQGQDTVGSRSSSFTGARSLVLEISPDGTVEELLSLKEETVHSLLWHQGELWLGTGQEGKLYRYTDDGLVLERELEGRQVTALVAGEGGAAAVTTNGGLLYQLPGGAVSQGTYTSAVLDAGQVARFGSFRWEGAQPGGTRVELELRSGMSLLPDATWTGWSVAAQGRELALRDVPHGRYVQWRATLRGKGEHRPRLATAELSYRQENLQPQIESLEVLDPGEILVPGTFNAQNQTFEPWSPNREGIFTSLRKQKPNDTTLLKTLWKKGYRTLRWKAGDANDDELVYALSFRRDGDDVGAWLPIVDELDETHYSFDSTVLADGVYRFRLTASDRPAQPSGEALSKDKLSEPVVIDHSSPRLETLKRHDDAIEVELRDALSPIRAAVYSVDAGKWQSVTAEDGLIDGRREVIRLAVPAGARLLLLRVTDAALNVVSFDLLHPPQ